MKPSSYVWLGVAIGLALHSANLAGTPNWVAFAAYLFAIICFLLSMYYSWRLQRKDTLP